MQIWYFSCFLSLFPIHESLKMLSEDDNSRVRAEGGGGGGGGGGALDTEGHKIIHS